MGVGNASSSIRLLNWSKVITGLGTMCDPGPPFESFNIHAGQKDHQLYATDDIQRVDELIFFEGDPVMGGPLNSILCCGNIPQGEKAWMGGVLIPTG